MLYYRYDIGEDDVYYTKDDMSRNLNSYRRNTPASFIIAQAAKFIASKATLTITYPDDMEHPVFETFDELDEYVQLFATLESI